jgi:hypothetical protein
MALQEDGVKGPRSGVLGSGTRDGARPSDVVIAAERLKVQGADHGPPL